MLNLIFLLAIIGVILALLPMDGTVKQLIIILVVLWVIFALASNLGPGLFPRAGRWGW